MIWSGYIQGMDEMLSLRMIKNMAGCSKHSEKGKNGANAEDFGKRDENHQDEQKPELPTPTRANVAPEAGQQLR